MMYMRSAYYSPFRQVCSYSKARAAAHKPSGCSKVKCRDCLASLSASPRLTFACASEVSEERQNGIDDLFKKKPDVGLTATPCPVAS